MIVFMLEEPSMEELLKVIVPKIIGDENCIYIHHEGKSDLMKSIPKKLKAWNVPNSKFVIVHDQDSNDCKKLKNKIEKLCQPYNKDVLVRIACHELESWYFGDIDAVEKAYNKNIKKRIAKRNINNPDAIVNPKLQLKKILPELTQRDGAKRIGKYMDINSNNSKSFQMLVEGIKKFSK